MFKRMHANMVSLTLPLPFGLCGCFGGRKRRKKPGTNMKEVHQSGSLAPLSKPDEVKARKGVIVKTMRFNEDTPDCDSGLNTYQDAELNEEEVTNIDQGVEPNIDQGVEPNIDQGVDPNIVVVEGVKLSGRAMILVNPPDDPVEGIFEEDAEAVLYHELTDAEAGQIQLRKADSQTISSLYATHLKQQIELADLQLQIDKRKSRKLDLEIEILEKQVLVQQGIRLKRRLTFI